MMIDPHDQGLLPDLRLIERRGALGWIAGGGATLLSACGRSSSAATLSACLANPSETRGPYPADGTGGRQVSNILEHAGIMRTDIRSSLGSRAVADGVPVRLTLTVVDAGAGCKALAGHVVYLWQCDRDGHYSLYDLPDRSWLRGAQITDANGRVSFTTIYPATYPGRYPHMHFEVFRNAEAATNGRQALLVSQLIMPAPISTAVYARAAGYERSRSSFPAITASNDYVLRDNDAAEVTAMTPSFSGDVATGLRAATTIGIA